MNGTVEHPEVEWKRKGRKKKAEPRDKAEAKVCHMYKMNGQPLINDPDDI